MSPPSGVHGGDGRARAAALGLDPGAVLDLSASLHPAAPDVRAVVAGHLDELGHYPDATGATRALASAIGVDPERLLLTDGGSEAIALLAAHLGRGWVDEPDFSLYARHLPVLHPSAGRWRSNPHNPSGLLAGDDEQAAVWDEAFFPLATGRWTRGDEHTWRLGSLTKLWACPGLRLGYAIAPTAAERDALSARQPRWSVNGLAAAVVEPLLACTDLAAMHDALATRRHDLLTVLAAHRIEATAPPAPWVLVPAEDELADGLAAQGVFVRRCESFGLPGVLRVAIPDADGLARLDEALAHLAAVAR